MLRRLVDVKQDEVTALVWSFVYFFCILCSYYMLRPVRDEMGIQSGVQSLQWNFTATFVVVLVAVPVYGALVAWFPRQRLLPFVYGFFVINLLAFFALFQSQLGTVYVARAFFVWVSAFNLYIVSVFWSFMADVFTSEQARRLYGAIAAGGSGGAILGPALTAGLVSWLGVDALLLISAAFLILALFSIRRLVRWATFRTSPGTDEPAHSPLLVEEATGVASPEEPVGGGVLSGVRLVAHSPYLLGICAYVLLNSALATFVYFQQAEIVSSTIAESSRRTALFARIDLAVNVLTFLGQLCLTSRLVARFGLSVALALLPLLVVLGFAALGIYTTLLVLVGFQVLRRAGELAIAWPTREMLYTVVTREEKYKSKNFIDTVVFRGGDAVSAWLFRGLSGLGLSLSAISFVAVPLAMFWLAVAARLGKAQERRQQRAPLRRLPVASP